MACETETGAEKWKFYTEGPVRCAPACWKGKVYAGSDDGYLYCLDAQTGSLVWKFRGTPSDRPDRRQLGNEHLISFWPVRGGPVVADGVVYFGAGIWPIFGVFLHALDAQTGYVKWTNGELNYIANVRGQAAFKLDTGLSPQGHLGLIRDKLVVPCGRSMPAGLDAATGKLIYYDQGARRGDSRVALHGDYAFVGKDAMVGLNDFCEVGSRWGAWASQHPYKMLQGCDASSVFEKGLAYGLANGIFYAYDLDNAKTTERQSEREGAVLRTVNWEPSVRWQCQSPYAGQKGAVAIKAGKRLYGCVGKKLLAVENLGGPPGIAWEKDVAGTPTSLAAADNKLFVAVAEGTVYCFGAGTPGKTFDAKPAPLETRKDPWAAKAAQIVNASGVKSGYCLVLGLSDGRLVEELLKQTELLVFVVDADAAKINALRRRCDAARLLGSRVELFVAKPFEFLFPPCVASLIVSEDAKAAGFSTAIDASKLLNVLRPYGGTLCLDLPGDVRPQFDAWAKSAAPSGAKTKQDGDWSLLVREGAPPGSAPWSHEGADAANTFCSQDDLVKGPLGFLWYGDIPAALPEYPSMFNMKALINGGRIYMHGPRSTTFVLCAYDAYTGRPLWKKEIPTLHRRASLAATADGVYFVADGGRIVCEPQTGKTMKTFAFNAPEGQTATGLRVADDVVVVECADINDARRAVWGGTYADDVSSTLICLDRKTGVELWRRAAKQRFHDRALAVGAGMVFCVDSMPLWMAEKTVPKPEDLKVMESTAIALDARTGRDVWSKKISYDATRTFTKADSEAGVDDGHIAKQYGNDWLSYSAQTEAVLTGRFFLGGAFEAKSGKVCWQNKEVRGTAPLIVRGKTLVTSGGNVYDILTGELTGNYKAVRKANCNYAIASKHLVMIRLNNASYYDAGQDKGYQLRNIRSGCLNNLIAADGLLNAPGFDNHCICNYPIQTSFAMVYMPEVETWSGTTPLTMTVAPSPKPPTPSLQKQPRK
jgi:outer membrane protein assembly factor BamB